MAFPVPGFCRRNTMGVVSADVLRAAQKAPKERKDLIVRIAGYSACFVELSTDCQNDLISRTENNL